MSSTIPPQRADTPSPSRRGKAAAAGPLGPRRSRWWIPVSILGGLLAAAVGTVVVTGVLRGEGPAVPPAATSTGVAVADGQANGCVAGTAITAADLLAEQARKDFTVTGAAQFVGAWSQFTGLVPGYSATTYEEVFTAATAAPFQESALSMVGRLSAPPTDSKDRRASLAEGKFIIESATDTDVVVSVLVAPWVDGAPLLSSDGQPLFGASTYTLEPTDQGWVITQLAGTRTVQSLISSGTPFMGGC